MLKDTKLVGKVETRVLEERELHDGQLVEVSRNFFAVCGPSNDVFYFGEDVDNYKDGKKEPGDDSWAADSKDFRAGLFLPARPLLGARFYQEIAPGVAMDRVEIVSDIATLDTPAGKFHDLVKTEETTPLEPGVKDYKLYAKGIGIVQDGTLLLVKYGQVSPR